MRHIIWKRGLCVSFATILLLGSATTLSSCGKLDRAPATSESMQETESQIDPNTPAWEQYKDEPITLDWYVNYSWFVTGWGENMVSKAITEETGVSINFMTPMGNEEEKVNALISSDALPDIVTLGWWEPQVNTIISKNMVYALDDLADKYDPYFYQVADQAVMDWYKKSDGKTYCYPCSSNTPQAEEKYDNIASNQTFLVRKDIYEAIGSPDMSTPEGFVNAVRMATTMFPTVDGEPLIPIGAHTFDDMGCTSFDKYLMNFLAVPWEKDGKFYDRTTDPEYITWLKTFRQLSEEGYLADCIFVDNRTQMSEKIAKGQYFCMLYQRTDLADQQKILYAEKPDHIYIAIDGPKNSKGDDHVLPTNSTNGWTITFISKNCKDPKRAIALMEYFLSEHGQKMISLGVEGEMYDVVDGQYVLRDEVAELLATDRVAYDHIYGADDTYWMLQDNNMQKQWMPPTVEPLRQMEEWTYPYSQYLGQYEIYMKEDSEVGEAQDKINLLWSKTLRQLLLADSEQEFDEIMADFEKERDALGFDLVLEESTRQMKENKRRLGLK